MSDNQPLCLSAAEQSEQPHSQLLPNKTVASTVFPNIQVDATLQFEFDHAMRDIERYAAQRPESIAINLVADRLSRIAHFSVHDGSSNGDCSGMFSSKDLNNIYINIPVSLAPDHGGTGKYLGEDGRWHDFSVLAVILHEVAHAVEVDVVSAEFSAELTHLMGSIEGHPTYGALGNTDGNVVIQHAVAELCAVKFENQYSHLPPRKTYHINPTSDNDEQRAALLNWYATEYPITGACANGTPYHAHRRECTEKSAEPSPEEKATPDTWDSWFNDSALSNSWLMYMEGNVGRHLLATLDNKESQELVMNYVSEKIRLHIASEPEDELT